MTALAILGLAGIHWFSTATLPHPTWLAIALGLTFLRGVVLVIDHRKREHLSVKTRERMFVWPLVLTSLMWAMLPLLVFPAADSAERLALVCVFSGLAGGAATVLAPLLWSARLYLASLLIPASVMIGDTPNSGPVIMALGFSFFVIMLLSHTQTHQILITAQRRLLDNQALLQRMQEQQALVEQLNDELLSTQKRLWEYNSRLEDEVEERTARIRLAFSVIENTAEGVMVVTPEGTLVEVNPAFTRITGYTPQDVIGKPATILRSDKHEQSFFDEMWRQLRASGQWKGQMWSRRKDGAVFLERRFADAVHDTRGSVTHYVAVFDDVTENYHKDQQLLHQALHDPLTGLGNRMLLRERLEHGTARAARYGAKLGVLFLDLDQFKSVNDSLGHHVGDQLLQAVATRLTGCLRGCDTLARLGGDEFVVLMCDIQGGMTAALLAQKLINVFAEPFDFPESRIHIRTSLGIAVYPDDGEDPDTLMRNADMALYAAKAAGRNTYHFFHPSLAEQAGQRLELELALREAIEHQELSLHYQPKLAAKELTFQGVEALLRWNRPGKGNIPPDRFIPIAEDSGLIGQLGAWVLSEACRQIAHWNQMGCGWQKVAINVSPHQLLHDDLVSMIQAESARHGIAPSLLEVEVTESCIMSEPGKTTPVLHALRAMGVTIAIDDFGTGHSSLAYLRGLPVDVLKIDRSFVREAESDESAQAIVRMIVALSKILKLQVVAEGIETAEQASLLMEAGCDLLQGYYFARPLPPREIEAWYRGRPADTEGSCAARPQLA